MSSNVSPKAKGRALRQNSRNLMRNGRRTGGSISRVDQALALRPEYSGQPACSHKVTALYGVVSTTVTTGQIALNVAIQSSNVVSFATRFQAYSEFRIVKAVFKVRNFSSVQPGIFHHWFSEDDTTAPTSTKAINSAAHKFAISSNEREHVLAYVPHDPAQQTWTLCSTGAPIIGYYKLYTDNANFGSSIVATAVACIEAELTIQFRGFI